ncbi:eCIS core domain-containing protein [Falsiroseomonas oryziterrae]|uniref:eCIS core domain-containing protein n=1 Tax=Falsiroseomonas oryziterrae TaxID=2911368 RepID=UPI001F41F9C9|nr:DUF4157 domain-containing protein [Roseomonas sp. NPKOSM-4]
MAQNGVTLMNPPSNSMQRKVIETRLEQAFGADFSGVRTQADAGPQGATSARAFVTGDSVFFGPGSRDDAGNRLLAHELTHTVQQGPLK